MIHRARVTGTDRDYEGSITIGRNLLDAADVVPHEKVQVVNVTNGERFETYAIRGEPREVCVNGAAARLAEPGDRVIVLSYGRYAEDETPSPTVVTAGERNAVASTA